MKIFERKRPAGFRLSTRMHFIVVTHDGFQIPRDSQQTAVIRWTDGINIDAFRVDHLDAFPQTSGAIKV